MSFLATLIQPLHESIIGTAAGSEEKRLQIMEHINPETFPTEELRQAARALKRPDFNYEMLLREYGKDIFCIVVDLSNKIQKLKSQGIIND